MNRDCAKAIALSLAMSTAQACQREKRVDAQAEQTPNPAPSTAPSPSTSPSTSATPVPTASASSASPVVPVHLKPCAKVLDKSRRALPPPPLNRKPELLPLMEVAQKGTPKRVRFRFHHPIAGCDCPSFSLTDYYEAPEETYLDIRLIPWTQVVFPQGVPDASPFELGKYYGTTIYEITGYFSGRMINSYGLEGPPDEAHRIRGDEAESWLHRYPEFCVENWCYIPDPDPGMYRELQSPAEFAADQKAYRDVLQDMRRAGAKLCNGKWDFRPPRQSPVDGGPSD